MLSRKEVRAAIPERQRLELLYHRYRSEYEDVLNKTYRKLRKLLVKSEINFNIKFRLKSFDSYFDKIILLRRKKVDPILLSDMLGLRIIVPFLEDVQAVEGIVSRHFEVIEKEHKGEENSFREFSYDSLHLLVSLPEGKIKNTIPYVRKVSEIQIRTILQEAWAEVEHELVYKSNYSVLNEPLKRKLASLNASLTLSDIIFQEIRDYHKLIAQRRQKRHSSFIKKAQTANEFFADNQAGRGVLPEFDSPELLSDKSKMSLEKQISQALEAHSNKNYKQAKKLYTKILHYKLKPAIRAVIYNHRGMVYFVQSDYNRSIGDFSRALKYDPQNMHSLTNRGMAYRMTHQYNLALKDFENSILKNPFQHESYHQRALTYFDIGDFSKALEDCEKALTINPKFEPAQYLKEIIRGELGF